MLQISEQQAQEMIQRFKIPPKPQILVDLQIEELNPDPDLKAYADIISRDVAMSAAILKTINSPRFGFNRAITDVKQSVVMLGTKFISTFATHFQMINILDQKASISFEKFWDTAAETADMMLIVRDQLTLSSECIKENAFAFGMFRDCGIPLMAIKYDDYRDVLVEANATPERIFTDIEDDRYNTNHAIVGFLLAGSWNFPKQMCQLILRHHDIHFLTDNTVDPESKDLYAISKLAANILEKVKYGKESSEWRLARSAVLGHFGLSDMDMDDLEVEITDKYLETHGDL